LTRRKKDEKEPTPEEIAALEKQTKAAYEEYLKNKDKKPDWMIDENSTMGEVLEFQAVTMPFKIQQMIDICDSQANSLSDFAENLDDPQDREYWLEHAEQLRQHAEKMRLQKGMYRKVSEDAKKELDELL
jgi:hypothetical protein